jgi:hypothetical protein
MVRRRIPVYLVLLLGANAHGKARDFRLLDSTIGSQSRCYGARVPFTLFHNSEAILMVRRAIPVYLIRPLGANPDATARESRSLCSTIKRQS